MLEDDVLGHPDLRPKDEVRILRDGERAGFHLGMVDVVEFRDRESGQSVISDVHEGEHPRPGLRGNVPAQRRDGVRAGIASGDHRRHP
jgi:hypothetical protein